MGTLYHSSWVNRKIKISHFVGFALGSMLAWLLFTPTLYGHSNEANATTLPTIPKAPANLVATALIMHRIDLAWDDSSNNEDGFKIERKKGATGTYTKIATVGPNVTSYSNTGLGENVTFFYRVRAYNAAGNSAYTNEAHATTLTTIPKAPANLVATAVIKHKIDLVWADSSNNEDGFKIERKKGATGTYTKIATVGPNVTSYSNLRLGVNVTFFYRVRAYNAAGNSAYTNEANATTLPNLPKTPDNLAWPVMPSTFMLEQNYPNPFNPSTTIAYSLPEGAHVTLKIMNVGGQEVATLVSGYHERGIHRVTFNASKLPSGAYLAVLKAGATTQVRRMTLAK